MPETEAEVNEAVLVDISAIDVDLRPARQMRVKLDAEALEHYAAHLDEMPPVKLMYDDGANTYWVIDGAHTINAVWAKGRKEVEAIVQEGTLLDAWALASRSNDEHGVRLHPSDIEHRVQEALKVPIIAGKSDREVATICAVSNHTVAKYRPAPTMQSTGNGSQSNAFKQGKDGKYRPASRPAKPKVKPEPKTESNGEPESGDDADLDLITAPDPEPPSKPAERTPEAIDQAAAKWGKILDEHCVLIRSFEKAGGIQQLAREWPKDRVETLLKSMREISRKFHELGDQIQEMLA
jgi:hypothetical protein